MINCTLPLNFVKFLLHLPLNFIYINKIHFCFSPESKVHDCTHNKKEADTSLSVWRMQPLGFVSAQQSEDESGLKQVHIISSTLCSCGDVLSQAPSDIFPCHFTFFTGLK